MHLVTVARWEKIITIIQLLNTGSVLHLDNRLQVYLYNYLLLAVMINSSKQQMCYIESLFYKSAMVFLQ